jgi:protein-S-isoprenylcysteine O-methyltransferase Ste14
MNISKPTDAKNLVRTGGTMYVKNDVSVKASSSTTASMVSRLFQIVVVLLLQAAVLFLSAGTINWIWAWIFVGISLLSEIINSAFLLKTSPETVAERGRPKEMKNWDKAVSACWSAAQYLLLPLTAGLDIRFAWTANLGHGWNAAGVFLYASGLGLFGWAMIANAYFSTVVRIQSDRGHTVCRTGPYQYVRHPGYLGTVLQSVGMALLLGSAWALIPAVAASSLMMIRTSLEDRVLQSELNGYKDYAQRTRYRMFPGIW